MDVHQAAKLLNYSERHTKRLAKEGKIPARLVKVERTILVNEYVFPDNLAEWFKKGGYTPYKNERSNGYEPSITKQSS